MPAEAVAAPGTLSAALLAVQGDVGGLGLTPDGTGQVGSSRFYKYLTLDRLLRAVRPLLTRNGLIWQTFPTTLEGKPALRYTLLHGPSCEAVSDTMLLMMDKETSQAQGSALTYAKRHALLSVLGLTVEADDDGREASQPERPAPVDPEAPLGERNMNAMREAIAERGLSASRVMAAAGCEEGQVVTIEIGRKVKALLDQHDAKAAAA
jgi:ERF superfamily